MTVEVTIDRPELVSPFGEAFRAFEDGDGNLAPPTVQSMREAAFERFRRLGFPTTKNEDWHYTSVAPITEHEYLHVTTRSGDVRPAALTPFQFGHPEWHQIVFVNGRYAPELSNADELPRGGELLTQQLEMNRHRVERILDLVRDAGGEASERDQLL